MRLHNQSGACSDITIVQSSGEMEPLVADFWRHCGPIGWTVRFYVFDDSPLPRFDIHALAQCLRLRSKHLRSAGLRDVRKHFALNASGAVKPVWLAPAASAALLFDRARELGREHVDAVESDFGTACAEIILTEAA